MWNVVLTPRRERPSLLGSSGLGSDLGGRLYLKWRAPFCVSSVGRSKRDILRPLIRLLLGDQVEQYWPSHREPICSNWR